jgi:hypothetical protein
MGIFNWFNKNKPDIQKGDMNANNQLLNYADPEIQET